MTNTTLCSMHYDKINSRSPAVTSAAAGLSTVCPLPSPQSVSASHESRPPGTLTVESCGDFARSSGGDWLFGPPWSLSRVVPGAAHSGSLGVPGSCSVRPVLSVRSCRAQHTRVLSASRAAVGALVSQSGHAGLSTLGFSRRPGQLSVVAATPGPALTGLRLL